MRLKGKGKSGTILSSPWPFFYLGLVVFTIGLIFVIHMLPGRVKVSDKSKGLNVLSNAGNPTAAVPQIVDDDDERSPPPLKSTAINAPSNSNQALRGSSQSTSKPDVRAGAEKLGLGTALLVMASNRPDYLQRCLSYILQFHPNTAVPITISEDGDHPGVSSVVSAFSKEFAMKSTLAVRHLHHQGQGRYENGYFALADHYKWALSTVFADSNTNHVIILEEDLQIAPDFFEYFAATLPLYDSDPTLLAVSAWNDNGFQHAVQDPKQLYRSDFFPGLGWMISRKVWEELGPKWPRAYWDDWLREPKQRQGRQFIRPEICRTLHYGARGVSNAQYSEFLQTIKLNTEYVSFTMLDLSYLATQEQWEAEYFTKIRQAKRFYRVREFFDLIRGRRSEEKEVRIVYDGLDAPTEASFVTVAKRLKVMDNIKANVPRTAYKGIVSFWFEGIKVHLVPVEFDQPVVQE